MSGHGSTSGTVKFKSIDKLYLLSAVEVYEENYEYDTVSSEETRQLDYYSYQGVSPNYYVEAKKNIMNLIQFGYCVLLHHTIQLIFFM